MGYPSPTSDRTPALIICLFAILRTRHDEMGIYIHMITWPCHCCDPGLFSGGRVVFLSTKESKKKHMKLRVITPSRPTYASKWHFLRYVLKLINIKTGKMCHTWHRESISAWWSRSFRADRCIPDLYDLAHPYAGWEPHGLLPLHEHVPCDGSVYCTDPAHCIKTAG